MRFTKDFTFLISMCLVGMNLYTFLVGAPDIDLIIISSFWIALYFSLLLMDA